MKDQGEAASSVFDVDRVSKLVDLMKLHDLSEVELREGRQKIRICRGPREAPRMPGPPPPPPPLQSGASLAASSPAATPAAPAESPHIVTFKSPMVGTYYSKPNPKAESYVRVGSKVEPSTILCIIEAMKVFNEIQADLRGEVVAVLVQDGEAVDFEKPLFKIDTSK
jgi:acetyl-CoA carboxylase biotin carboxyl carrier protein